MTSEAVAGIGEQITILTKACDELSHRELIRLLSELTTVLRSVPALEHRVLARLLIETEPHRLGESSWKGVLTTALRCSGAEAARRLVRAKTLGPRQAMSGEPLPPLWEATAVAQKRGLLSEEHVAVIARFHKNLPKWVDVDTRAHADAQLASLGSGLSPEDLFASARHLTAKIDQDGPEPSLSERMRKRGIRFGRQQADGYSRVSGWMTARCRAFVEAVNAKEAAPGRNMPDEADPAPSGEEMSPGDDAGDAQDAEAQQRSDDDAHDNNAQEAQHDNAQDDHDDNAADAAGGDEALYADESPRGGDETSAGDDEVPARDDEVPARDDEVPARDDEVPAPVDDHDPLPDRGSDTRTEEQRNHDALEELARRALESGELGQHNGLPVTVIVSTTLQELERGAGIAVTGGGSFVPMPDLIRMAANAFHYLYVYDEHTGQSLYLGRAKRLASAAQRIVLHARERGCTRPGCTAPGYWCQVHHAVADWKNNGQTNIDDLTLACGPDNRMVEKTEWTTAKNVRNQTEWIPPPDLDAGQHRVNGYHHPERYLLPDDDLPSTDLPDGDDP